MAKNNEHLYFYLYRQRLFIDYYLAVINDWLFLLCLSVNQAFWRETCISLRTGKNKLSMSIKKHAPIRMQKMSIVSKFQSNQ